VIPAWDIFFGSPPVDSPATPRRSHAPSDSPTAPASVSSLPCIAAQTTVCSAATGVVRPDPGNIRAAWALSPDPDCSSGPAPEHYRAPKSAARWPAACFSSRTISALA
jgi:hypothetical protein